MDKIKPVFLSVWMSEHHTDKRYWFPDFRMILPPSPMYETRVYTVKKDVLYFNDKKLGRIDGFLSGYNLYTNLYLGIDDDEYLYRFMQGDDRIVAELGVMDDEDIQVETI